MYHLWGFFVFLCTRTASHLCLCMMALKSFPSLQLVVKLSQRRPWYPSTILWDQSNSFSLAVMSSDWPFTWMSEIWERSRSSKSAISQTESFTVILEKTARIFFGKVWAHNLSQHPAGKFRLWICFFIIYIGQMQIIKNIFVTFHKIFLA